VSPGPRVVARGSAGLCSHHQPRYWIQNKNIVNRKCVHTWDRPLQTSLLPLELAAFSRRIGDHVHLELISLELQHVSVTYSNMHPCTKAADNLRKMTNLPGRPHSGLLHVPAFADVLRLVCLLATRELQTAFSATLQLLLKVQHLRVRFCKVTSFSQYTRISSVRKA
jgi:hypothetical protein